MKKFKHTFTSLFLLGLSSFCFAGSSLSKNLEVYYKPFSLSYKLKVHPFCNFKYSKFVFLENGVIEHKVRPLGHGDYLSYRRGTYTLEKERGLIIKMPVGRFFESSHFSFVKNSILINLFTREQFSQSLCPKK